MTRISALGSHLMVTFRERRAAEGEAPRLGELPFITISRQAGAGGRSLAQAILAELGKVEGDPRLQGWTSFDAELCKIIVSDPQINVSLRELLSEDYRTRAEDFVSALLGKSFQDDVQKKISQTIRHLALVGKAILIGRGGASITRDLEPGIHLHLVAPREVRVRWMMEEFTLPEKEAARRMDEQDRSRARMVKHRFKQDIDDPLLYDAIWNTGVVPLEVIARCVVEMVRAK